MGKLLKKVKFKKNVVLLKLQTLFITDVNTIIKFLKIIPHVLLPANIDRKASEANLRYVPQDTPAGIASAEARQNYSHNAAVRENPLITRVHFLQALGAENVLG